MLIRQQRLEQLNNMKKEKRIECVTNKKRMAAEVNVQDEVIKKVKKDHRDQSEIEEEQMLEEFDVFNSEYEGLLHELKQTQTEGKQIFKISINMNENEEENSNIPDDMHLNEEFAYRLLQKSMLTRIDESTINTFGNYTPQQNEYHDEFEYFS